LGVFGVQRHLLGHLVGQLARGQQHEGAHRMARGRGRGVFMRQHALQQRQGERGRLAGAGLGRAHHVLAGEHDRDGLLLDQRHGFVAHVGHGALQGFRQRYGGVRSSHEPVIVALQQKTGKSGLKGCAR